MFKFPALSASIFNRFESLKKAFPTFRKMGAGQSREIILEGFCHPQYQAVKEHLAKMLQDGAEENVQLCVFVKGQCVIDLYGSAVNDRLYNADKLQVRLILSTEGCLVWSTALSFLSTVFVDVFRQFSAQESRSSR